MIVKISRELVLNSKGTHWFRFNPDFNLIDKKIKIFYDLHELRGIISFIIKVKYYTRRKNMLFSGMSVEEILGEYVCIDRNKINYVSLNDDIEKGSKMMYQIAEILIYIGWPLLVSFFVYCLFDSLLVLIAVFCIVLVWPVIKFKIIKILNFRKKLKDPRYMMRSSSFWFDGFMFVGSEPLRQVRQNAALSKSLDVIYNYFNRFSLRPEGCAEDWWVNISRFKFMNIMIKKWTDFWFGMPIAQDVRTRLSFTADCVEKSVGMIYENNASKGSGEKIRIVTLAGGTKQDIIIAVANLINKFPDIRLEVVCVEPDGAFAVRRARKLIKHFSIPKNIFIDIFKKVSLEKKRKTLSDILFDEGYNFNDFDLVVCVGLGDYMFGDKLVEFIRMLDNKKKIITANVSNNFIERFFLHHLIQWFKMQYLSEKTYSNKLREALGDERDITIYKTPNKIFNIAVIE